MVSCRLRARAGANPLVYPIKLLEVRDHCPFGHVGVARSDRLEDARVRPVGDLHLPGHLQSDVALVSQPINHGIMDRRKDRVTRDLGENEVKINVGALERRQVIYTLAVSGESRLQSREVFSCGVARRVTRKRDFEERARLLKVLLTARLL